MRKRRPAVTPAFAAAVVALVLGVHLAPTSYGLLLATWWAPAGERVWRLALWALFALPHTVLVSYVVVAMWNERERPARAASR